MARVNVPVFQINRAGIIAGSGGAEVTGDAVNGHYVLVDAKTFISVRNAGGTARGVTFWPAYSPDGAAVAGRAETIGANAAQVLGPFPKVLYQQVGADEGRLHLDLSHSDLKIQAWRI